MNSPNLFARIFKVDEAQRLVYGRACAEVPDATGELFDYETSKPYFQEWSAETFRDTAGKSLGNVRAMHDNIAAGKLTEIDFNDVEKAIDVCSKIVDDDEWNKVMEGLYTGYSIGGSYLKTWADTVDGKKVKRYTAKPTELSLVDKPCIPTAKFFQIVKRDGTVEEGVFKNWESPGSATSGIAGYDEEGAKKVAERDDVDPKAGEDKYGDVKFADPKNKKYPIDTEEHIRAAWNYINKPKNSGKYSTSDANAIKQRIIAAWKHVIDPKGPPSAAEKADMTTELRKGMYGVSQLADLVCRLQELAFSQKWEQQAENDDSVVWKELLQCVTTLGHVLSAMAAEESDEVAAEAENGGAGDPTAPSVFCRSIAATLGDALQKVTMQKLTKSGARNSAKDLALIQNMHDCAKELGAACSKSDDSVGKSISIEVPTMTQSNHIHADADALVKAKQAEKDAEMAAKEKAKKAGAKDDGKDDDDDDDSPETPEEKKERLARRKKAKEAAKGLTAEQVGGMIETANATLLEGLFKGLGLLPADDQQVQKAAGVASGEAVEQRRPALFAVERTGEARKADGVEDLIKSVPAVPVEGDAGKVATFIKSLHARGPDEVWDPTRFGRYRAGNG